MHCAKGCHALIAELEAKNAELECAARREREEKERAQAACQLAQNRLDFVEPRYWAVRRDAEGLWAANTSLRAKLRGEEAGRAEAVEERDMYRSAAAASHALRDELAAERDARARAEEANLALISHLRVDPRTSKVVYRNGPNRPPSARKRAPAGGDAPAGAHKRPRREGPAAGAARREGPAAGRATRDTNAPTGLQGPSTIPFREMPTELRPCSRAGAARATGCLSTTREGSSWICAWSSST